ncbi:aspartyl protease family protein [Nonlabens agnitus]|uniref:aspartyl protease family protein n=1 Tax=Nonlabens agnitus TaxID=870484 RepID=UPI001559B0D8|nr:aspartyl protease family protein [Nonlabens agnitus]
MSRLLVSVFFFLNCFSALGQQGFSLPDGVDEVTIPFTRSQNLIVIPVKVNGTALNFILDTGASRSIIFNLQEIDSLELRTGQPLKISGYGERKPFDVYYSDKNVLDIYGYSNKNAGLFVMANDNINLSGFLGVTIHGLMGCDFFADFLVVIDYENEVLKLYRDPSFLKRKLRRSTRIPITIKNRKPYFQSVVQNNGSEIELNTLIDTGNGDALWLLPPLKKAVTPNKSFEDFLGMGLSGKVKGQRSKVDRVYLGKHKLNKVTVSLPEMESLTNRKVDVNQEEDYKGSIGGEVLSRFKVVLDYKNESMYLRPESNLEEGFFYNMAGLELIEGDLEVFTTIENAKTESTKGNYGRVNTEGSFQPNSRRRVIKITPKLLISYVRPESPADEAGLKVGDEIIKVNSVSQSSLSLTNVSKKFFRKPYSTIRFTVKRGEAIFKVKFELVPVI